MPAFSCPAKIIAGVKEPDVFIIDEPTKCDLLAEIRTAGANEAKTIKNAFKEASVPSKGLMYEL